jgi:hypothetical protein
MLYKIIPQSPMEVRVDEEGVIPVWRHQQIIILAALAELWALELVNVKASEVFFESVPCLQASITPLN